MVKDYSDNERGNPQPPLHGMFPVIRKIFVMHHPTDTIVSLHTSCGALHGTTDSSLGVEAGINAKTHRTLSKCSTTELYPVPHKS